MFRVTLQVEGYTVFEAPDARTALRLMAEGRPDLVVLDLILPDLDGFDLVQLLRERPEAWRIADGAYLVKVRGW